jgi:hypothetical protein
LKFLRQQHLKQQLNKTLQTKSIKARTYKMYTFEQFKTERNTNATIVMALPPITKLIEYKKIGIAETNTQLVCLSSEIRQDEITSTVYAHVMGYKVYVVSTTYCQYVTYHKYYRNKPRSLPSIVLKSRPVIDPAKTLGHNL